MLTLPYLLPEIFLPQSTRGRLFTVLECLIGHASQMLLAIHAPNQALIGVEVLLFGLSLSSHLFLLESLRGFQAEALPDESDESARGLEGAKEKLRPY